MHAQKEVDEEPFHVSDVGIIDVLDAWQMKTKYYM